MISVSLLFSGLFSLGAFLGSCEIKLWLAKLFFPKGIKLSNTFFVMDFSLRMVCSHSGRDIIVRGVNNGLLGKHS